MSVKINMNMPKRCNDCLFCVVTQTFVTNTILSFYCMAADIELNDVNIKKEKHNDCPLFDDDNCNMDKEVNDET